MIDVTDEMVAAFSGADFTGLGNADWEDAHVRAGLAAVLAIVERDWNMQPNPNARQQDPVRWRCNRTSRCIREDGHTGPHAFTGPDPQ